VLLAYRWTAYALFLTAAALMVGWLADVPGWPVTIDGGAAAPWPRALAVNLALLAAFGLQHSGMARAAFKRAWTRRIPAEAERSTYVLLSSLLLAALCWAWEPMPRPVWRADGAAWWLLQGLGALGWTTAVGASFLISHAELFGLRRAPPARSEATLTERGLYRWIRHPIMTGFLLAFWAAPAMSAGHLLFAAGMTLYVVLGVALEERDLLAAHGAAYAAYRERAGMLLPRRPRAKD
jgi:protein-S-isoprenylcysteine O-methyltransferase Ste14